MPFYPPKRIEALAGNRAVYLRGVRGYNAGWVRQYAVSSNVFYPEYIIATVQEGTTPYHAEIGFDERDEAEYTECNCGHCGHENGACKHVIAVLLHKYYKDVVEQLPTAGEMMRAQAAVKTAPAVQQLIDRYMTQESLRLGSEVTSAGTVTLSPILSLDTGRAVLTFTVGVTRPYTVKNLTRFAENMDRCTTVEYGKQLCLVHRPESFTPQSRPLLDFLLAEMGERPLPAGSFSGVSGGELPLSAAGFDRFFALYKEQTVTLRRPDGDQRIRLTDGNPILPVTLENAADGMRVYTTPVLTASGLHTLYVLHHGVLYRTDEEYSRRMTALVQFSRHAGNGLPVAAAQLPAFCSGVLNTVRPYVQLDGDEDALDRYRPRPLEVRIRLDAPEDNAITAEVTFHYGEDTVLPFAENADTVRAAWRDPLEELRIRTAIRRHFTALQPQTGRLVLRGDDDRLFAFLHSGMDDLRRVAQVETTARLDAIAVTPVPPLSVGMSLIGGLLEMDVALPELDPIDLEGIITGYRESRSYHRLHNGRFVSLNDGALSDFAELVDGLDIAEQTWRTGHVTLPKHRALYLENLFHDHNGFSVRRDGYVCQLVERFRAATQNDYPVPEGLQGTLRGYQKDGYRWLRTLEELGFGGILADDMGLGKTVQMIALLLAAKEQSGAACPSLVVCPSSLVLNWEREIHRFAPALRVLCVLGDAATRYTLLQTAAAFDVVITSYDLLKRDMTQYGCMEFHYHVLDEAQYIKNSATQNAKSVKAIRSRQRFALTGTPMENRLSELWSIFDFLMPDMLFHYTKFKARFETPIVKQGDERALERLRRTVAPFILRRLKKDVLSELPPKTERVLPSTMEDAQRQVYRASLQQLRAQLEGYRGAPMTGQGRITVLAMLTRLRQICCDPRLCCEGYTGESCKLEGCIELIKEAASGGHKVLLFSQFTSMLALLQQRLREEDIAYYVLQGSTSKEQRAALVDAFNTDTTPVFLISLKAGGTGLNLTGADMVIHYDPWWNLAAQNQATDRAYRIGQKNPVQVVRLIARDTVEEKIVEMQESKWELAQAVVGENAAGFAHMTAEELLELLE